MCVSEHVFVVKNKTILFQCMPWRCHLNSQKFTNHTHTFARNRTTNARTEHTHPIAIYNKVLLKSFRYALKSCLESVSFILLFALSRLCEIPIYVKEIFYKLFSCDEIAIFSFFFSNYISLKSEDSLELPPLSNESIWHDIFLKINLPCHSL